MKLTEARILPQDLPFLASNLRPSDAAELKAYGFSDALAGLEHCTKAGGRRHVLRDPDGLPVCTYGLSRPAISHNSPWMLGTTLIAKHRKEFWRHSVRVVSEFMSEGKPLINYTHADNKTAILWLQRLGFFVDFDKPVTRPTGSTFVPFYKQPPCASLLTPR